MDTNINQSQGQGHLEFCHSCTRVIYHGEVVRVLSTIKDGYRVFIPSLQETVLIKNDDTRQEVN